MQALVTGDRYQSEDLNRIWLQDRIDRLAADRSAARNPEEQEMAALLPIIHHAMDQAQGALHALGITGVHDKRIMGGQCGKPSLTAWQTLARLGKLTLRAWVGLPGECLDDALRVGLCSGFGGPSLKLGHAKFFSDRLHFGRFALVDKSGVAGDHDQIRQ